MIMMVRMAAKVIEVSCYHNATRLFWKMSKVRRNYSLGREDGIDLPQ